MKEKHRTKRIQRYRKMLGIIVLMLTITLIGVVVSATVLYKRKNACKTPDTILVEYMMHIPKQEARSRQNVSCSRLCRMTGRTALQNM